MEEPYLPTEAIATRSSSVQDLPEPAVVAPPLALEVLGDFAVQSAHVSEIGADMQKKGQTQLSGTKAVLADLLHSFSYLPTGREKADLAEEMLSASVKTEDMQVLFNAVLQDDNNETVALAQQMLAQNADAAMLLPEIVEQYYSTQNVDQRIALSEVVRYLENPDAVPQLAAIVRHADSLSDPLALASVDALGTLDCEEGQATLTHELEYRTLESDREILRRSLRRSQTEMQRQ